MTPAYSFARIPLPAAALLGILILTHCGHSEKEKTQHEVTVGITTTYLGEAATFVALEKGYFEKNGLDVTLKHNASGSISIRDLFDGKIDIAHVAETPIAYALHDTGYYKGPTVPPFQIFADMIYSDNIQKIIARRDRGIEQPSDIRGKKVAIFKGTQLDYYFDSFLLEHQIPDEQITYVDMRPTDQVEAIVEGDIDAAVTWEPYASYIEDILNEDGIILQTELTYSTLWMATTLNSYAREHPSVLTAYLKSLSRAQKYIQKHPLETQKMLAKHTGIAVNIIQSLWNEIDYELSLSERMLTLLEDQARWLNRNNMADTTGFNMEQLVNYEPMQKIYPQGISIIK